MYVFTDSDLKKLQELGFSREDSRQALQVSSGKLDDAAVWLTHNATVYQQQQVAMEQKGYSIAGIEVSRLQETC